jgi:hypothetical protein
LSPFAVVELDDSDVEQAARPRRNAQSAMLAAARTVRDFNMGGAP